MAEVIPYEFSQTLQGKMITKLLGKVKCVFSQQSLQNFLSFYGEKYCHLIIGKLDVKGQVNKPVDTYAIREQCFNNYLKLIGAQRENQGSNSTLDLLENQFPAIT